MKFSIFPEGPRPFKGKGGAYGASNLQFSKKGFTPFRDKSLTGFTILEIIVSISVITIGIVGIYFLIAPVFIASMVNSDKFLASQLCQEGLELARNIRDNNWLEENDWRTGLSGCSTGCEIDYDDLTLSAFQDRFLKIDPNGFYNYESGTESRFKRKIVITEQPQFLNVKVIIIWVGAKGLSTQQNQYTVEESLYDWR